MGRVLRLGWLGLTASVLVLVSCSSGSATASKSTSSTTPVTVRSHQPMCGTGSVRCSITDGSVTLAVAGSVAPPTRVAPPAGHVLGTVDRDAGVSVRLRDGSRLWLFGDTAARDDTGQVQYFQIGSASWASAADPTATLDAVDGAGVPITFADPTAEFPPCPHPGQRQGMWPASAVVEPMGPLDRVVVWLDNVCLGTGPILTGEGMSVAEWFYDPTHPPMNAPIRATILNQRLFPTDSYGAAAMLVGGPGHLVDVYACQRPRDARREPTSGSCEVAQTSLDTVADPTTYRPWNGTAFVAASGSGAPMKMPPGRTAPYPPGGFSVDFDPTVGAYLMVYSPWPASTAVVDIRIAAHPEGPWSRPMTVALPGCADHLGSRLFGCYAAALQPAFSTTGQLGLGYYDSMISSFPTRGSYMVSTLPVRVS